MGIKQAIEVLENHQKWRLGQTDEMPHSPKELTDSIDKVLSIFKKYPIGEYGIISLEGVTRVEVIDENGRSYTNWKSTNQVEASFQDASRTLKLFIYN